MQERKPGDVFFIGGLKLQVVECPLLCYNCYFNFSKDCKFFCTRGFYVETTGPCSHLWRTDKKDVVFVDITYKKVEPQSQN